MKLSGALSRPLGSTDYWNDSIWLDLRLLLNRLPFILSVIWLGVVAIVWCSFEFDFCILLRYSFSANEAWVLSRLEYCCLFYLRSRLVRESRILGFSCFTFAYSVFNAFLLFYRRGMSTFLAALAPSRDELTAESSTLNSFARVS